MRNTQQALTHTFILGGSVLLLACASPPHDTEAFKGVVYSRDVQNSSGQTYAIPVGGAAPLFLTTGGGTFIVYVLKLDDNTTYAVRSSTLFEAGSCLAVFMNSERAKTAGYLNIKETTVVPSTGCKASVSK